MIEKVAFAIYFALKKMEDLLGGVKFTIKTDHKNLQFLNQAGSKKVLGWKLAIQAFDFNIVYIKGEENIPADTFSRLVPRPPEVRVSTIQVSNLDERQRKALQQCHTDQGAHWGVTRTIEVIRAKRPDVAQGWPRLREDVQDYVRACPTCQKMSQVRIPIRASRYVLASLEPMVKISMDTIGPLPADARGNTYIITLIDNFSRYLELYPSQDVSAISAARALFDHACRFGYPEQLVTDSGSQYCNELFRSLAARAGIERLVSTPYSKEENGLVERANKEVNRSLRNLVFDKDIESEWSEYLPLIMRHYNTAVKKPLGGFTERTDLRERHRYRQRPIRGDGHGNYKKATTETQRVCGPVDTPSIHTHQNRS